MQVIILRILSLFMSVIMFFSGLISGFFGLFDPYRKSYTALEDGYITDWGNGKLRIIESYEELLEVYSGDSDEIAEYDEEYFEEKSLLAVAVGLPQTNYYAVIDSIEESGDTVTVKYHLESKGVGAAVLSSQALLVEVSKDISRLTLYKEDELIFDSVSELKAEPEPTIIEYKIYNYLSYFRVPSEDESVTIVSDCDKWLECADYSSKSDFDEEFFDANSLAIITVVLPDNGYNLTVDSAKEANGSLQISYSADYKERIGYYDYCKNYIAVVISKDTETVEITADIPDRPFQNTTYWESPHLLKADFYDGYAAIFSDYKSVHELYTYSELIPDSFCNEFFKDYSLALIAVSTPNTDCSLDFGENGIVENENSLEVTYSIKENGYGYDEMIDYECYFIKINKNITEVRLNENVFKNRYSIHDSSVFNLSNTENGTVISDYESWNKIYGGSDLKYNEDYFTNNSIALIPVEYSDINSKTEIRYIEEKDGTLNVNYRIYASETSAASTEQVILIETTKDIVSISADCKQIINTYDVWREENESAFVISDYDTFAAEFADNTALLNSYNEEFFETKSLAFAPFALGASNLVYSIDYVEENGNTLDFGYLVYDLGGAGMAVVRYYTAVVEVSKNVDTVNVCRNCMLESTGKLKEPVIKNTVKNYHYWDIDIEPKDGYFTFIHDYDSLKKIALKKFVYTEDYDEAFFDNYSLAAISVCLPDARYEPISYSAYESDGTLYFDYATEAKWDEYAERVVYSFFLVKISKSVTDIKINENSFRNRFGVYDADTFDFSNTEPFVADTASEWNDIYNGNDEKLTKYNSEYFEDYSLAVIPVTLPDENREIDLKCIKETGSTLEVDCRILFIDKANSINQVILIETSKNIKSISVETQKLENTCTGYLNGNMFIFEHKDEKVTIISDYETFSSVLASSTDLLDKYNEDFFESNSLAIIGITLPDYGYEIAFDYAEENGNALDLGYIEMRFTNWGLGTNVDGYAVVEISKNIDTVNVSSITDY